MKNYVITVIGQPSYQELVIYGEFINDETKPYYKIEASSGYCFYFPKNLTIITHP